MSLSNLFYIILAILIPFLLFILPAFFDLINYSWVIPQEFIIALIVSLIVGVIFSIFHTQNTNEKCNKINSVDAFISGLKATLIIFSTTLALYYFPSIIEPFSTVFRFNNSLAQIIYRSIIIYAVVFLYLMNVSFTSIKKTCKANIDQIKQTYKKLESEIK